MWKIEGGGEKTHALLLGRGVDPVNVRLQINLTGRMARPSSLRMQLADFALVHHQYIRQMLQRWQGEHGLRGSGRQVGRCGKADVDVEAAVLGWEGGVLWRFGGEAEEGRYVFCIWTYASEMFSWNQGTRDVEREGGISYRCGEADKGNGFDKGTHARFLQTTRARREGPARRAPSRGCPIRLSFQLAPPDHDRSRRFSPT